MFQQQGSMHFDYENKDDDEDETQIERAEGPPCDSPGQSRSGGSRPGYVDRKVPSPEGAADLRTYAEPPAPRPTDMHREIVKELLA